MARGEPGQPRVRHAAAHARACSTAGASPNRCWRGPGGPRPCTCSPTARCGSASLPTRFPFVMVLPQAEVDQALEDRARAEGAQVLRGHEVVALHQDDAWVTVTARPRDDDDPAHARTVRARYVVGADGAHSTVREPGRGAVPRRGGAVVGGARRRPAVRAPARRRAGAGQHAVPLRVPGALRPR
nr:FAD-dependent monooxygenase [Angustibacter aerolatus]